MADIGEFEKGVWVTWGYSPIVQDKKGRIQPGESIEFYLSSKAPPGIVKCKAGGGEFGQVVEGGEDPPSELEAEIPVNTDLAHGYTLGPDSRLSKISKEEKIKYLQENLSKFWEAGWMSIGTRQNYENILKTGDLEKVWVKAQKDFENRFISNEVFQIIKHL